ncbi:MAG TPA: hybrid sensor histidine kinase/response regulator [Candidatus Deferrimicrobium sp.]|nr:hybrid sensor histidine kinase/response regulator [Candidatus Deferrimicrobium sp.]
MNASNGNLRVLIVDDSSEDRALYRRLMTQDASKSYEFIECDQGEDGLDLFRRHQPDCVLLDYSLPDIDGLEFLDRLKSDSPESFLPVVMLTGQGNEKVAVEAMKCGAQDYLTKGLLTLEGLRVAIENAIGRVALQRKARELESVKSDFLSTASHELRTPLTIIREFVSLVRDGVAGSITVQQTECLDSALQNCDRLSKLINDILDLRRIEAGDPGLRRTRVELQLILDNCRRDFLPQCEKKRQVLEVSYPTELPPVLCDSYRMIQVVVNLVGNAHKFTPEGGRIVVTASTLGDTGEFVQVQIRDTGPGISREFQGRIFEKFTQIGRQHGPGAMGTGLGLSIAKNIITMHGGQIAVESTPGSGSTFTVTIPAYSEAREAIAFLEDHLLAATAANTKSIVIVIGLDAGSPLEEVERFTHELLRRRGDATLLVKSEALLLVIAETEERNETAICSRIVRAIQSKYPITGVSATLNVIEPMAVQLDRLRNQLQSSGRVVSTPDRPAMSDVY